MIKVLNVKCYFVQCAVYLFNALTNMSQES